MLCSVCLCELDLRSSKSMDIEAMRSMSQGGRVHGARVGKDVTDTHTHDQCGIFTGIGPEAKSSPATLRIKYGMIPKKSGIYPNPAAESKVG